MPHHERIDGKGRHVASLTVKQVVAIRAAKTTQRGACKRIAHEYGVTDRQVRRIWDGSKWGWLMPEGYK